MRISYENTCTYVRYMCQYTHCYAAYNVVFIVSFSTCYKKAGNVQNSRTMKWTNNKSVVNYFQCKLPSKTYREPGRRNIFPIKKEKKIKLWKKEQHNCFPTTEIPLFYNIATLLRCVNSLFLSLFISVR